MKVNGFLSTLVFIFFGFTTSTLPPTEVSSTVSIEIQVKLISNSFAQLLNNPTAKKFFKPAFRLYRENLVEKRHFYSNGLDIFAYGFIFLLAPHLEGMKELMMSMETDGITSPFDDLVRNIASQEIFSDFIDRLLEDQSFCIENLEEVNIFIRPEKIPTRPRDIYVEVAQQMIDNFTLKVIVGALKNLNVKVLDLSGNRITDISPLASLSTLEELIISYNCACRNLISLNLQVADFSPFASLPNLKYLDLRRSRITDVSSLVSLKNLQYLNLSYNQINDISSLASFHNLRELVLSRNHIDIITPLAPLVNLVILNLTGNRISDISALSSLSQLQRLNLDKNQIADISALAFLTQLQKLNLSANEIADFSVLDSLSFLSYLKTNSNYQTGYVHPSDRKNDFNNF